jgi:hypothetical protein
VTGLVVRRGEEAAVGAFLAPIRLALEPRAVARGAVLGVYRRAIGEVPILVLTGRQKEETEDGDGRSGRNDAARLYEAAHVTRSQVIMPA